MTVISLSKIRCDGGTQFRAALDPAVITEYTEAMLGGDVFPAVVLFFDGEAYWLADGFYRCAASREAHLDEVPADVRPGTQREARLYAATEANRTHGVRMNNEEKRARVLAVLQDEEGRRWSDREIARRCGVDGKTVATLRNQLRNSAVDEPRQGADGKVRKLPRKPEDVIQPLDDVGASNNAAARHDEEPCKTTSAGRTTETTKTSPAPSAALTAGGSSSPASSTAAPGKTTAPTAGRTYHSLLDNAALEGKPIVHRDLKPDTEEETDAAGGPAPAPALRPEEVQEQDEESPEACGYRPNAALAFVALALKLGEGATLAQIEARIGELLATGDAIAKRGYIQGELEALEYVAEHVLVMSPGTWLGATAPELRNEIEEAVEVLEEKASRLGDAERQAAELQAQIGRLEARPRQRDAVDDREAFQEGEREALQQVAAYLGCEGDMEEIAAAIEALKDAAPGPGPGEEAAELQGQIRALEARLAEAIAEQVRHQKDAAQARAEISHLQKEVSALKGQLALPRVTPEVELEREGSRIGEQVIWRRGKNSVRALIVAWTGRGSAHLWVRPNPTAKSAEGRSGYWDLAGLAELTPDPQQDGPGAVRAALDALERYPDSPWLPGLRAAYSGIVAKAQVQTQEEAPYRPSRCGKAKVVHAVGLAAPAHAAALCTYRPSYSSKGWVEAPGAAIDCDGCLERIGRAS